jgi:dTDP-glucose 4,6-dehydratase
MHIINAGVVNEIYNISGNVELPNQVVIKKILRMYFNKDMDHRWEDFIMPSQRVGQDVRYSINDDKLKSLGWQPQARRTMTTTKAKNIIKRPTRATMPNS